MIEKYQPQKVLLQTLERFFLTFSLFFISAIVYSQLEWGLEITDELLFLLVVFIYSLFDIIVYMICFMSVLGIERRRKKTIPDLVYFLSTELPCLLFNSLIFILFFANVFDNIIIRYVICAVASIASATLLRIGIAILMRRENR